MKTPETIHDSTQDCAAAYIGFTMMFAIALLVPLSRTTAGSIPTFVAFGAAVLVLLLPRFALGLPILAASLLAHYVQALPDVTNHMTFDAVMSLAVLAAYAAGARASRRTTPDLGVMMAFLRRSIRPAVIAVYGFAVLSKLNRDFLDPLVSCATELTAKAGFISSRDSLTGVLAIYGTLVIEVLIPVLLLLPRYRLHGVIVGVSFHLVTNAIVTSITSWPLALFVGYGLFLPDPAWDRVRAALSRAIAVKVSFVQANFIKGLLAALLCGSWLLPREAVRMFTAYIVFPTYCLAFLAAAAAPFFKRLPLPTPGNPPASPWPFVGALPTALLVASSLSPYLGFKTLNSMTMFSNLRTENGRTNHLFIPVSAQVFNHQRDLVEVVQEVGHDAGAMSVVLPMISVARQLDLGSPRILAVRRIDTKVPIDSDAIRAKYGFFEKRLWTTRIVSQRDQVNRRCLP